LNARKGRYCGWTQCVSARGVMLDVDGDRMGMCRLGFHCEDEPNYGHIRLSCVIIPLRNLSVRDVNGRQMPLTAAKSLTGGNLMRGKFDQFGSLRGRSSGICRAK
jgi:hypothetical protein